MGDDLGSYGDREAVRLPLWASAIVSAVLLFTISLLSHVPWQPALVAVLGGLGPVVCGTEFARQRAWSPLSVLDAAQAARNDAAARVPVAEFQPDAAVAAPLDPGLPAD